jgi:hypothetical protein
MGKVIENREDQVANAVILNENLIAEIVYKILSESPRSKRYYQLMKKSFNLVAHEDIYAARLQRFNLLNKILKEFITPSKKRVKK